MQAPFTRDRDRILRSRAFRRLAGKTQVVAAPGDPLVRTRLTHTLEVAAIARAIGAELGLRDALLEAIALGHDLGHPAFGHAGEQALAALVPGGFHHAAQSIRVTTVLEPLDLSPEVADGILKHSKGKGGPVFPRGVALASTTREAHVVRAADLYAYACHDLDDAYLLGALAPAELPARATRVLGTTPDEVREALVARTVRASGQAGEVTLDDEGRDALDALRAFLYANLYESPRIARQTAFVRELVATLFDAYRADPVWFADQTEALGGGLGALRPALLDGPRGFADAFATLGDRQALALFHAVRPPFRAMAHLARPPSPDAVREPA